MIKRVEEDSSQMRSAIYELARAGLRIETLGVDQADQKRISKALETAIQAVEGFTIRHEENFRLSFA